MEDADSLFGGLCFGSVNNVGQLLLAGIPELGHKTWSVEGSALRVNNLLERHTSQRLARANLKVTKKKKKKPYV